VVPHEDVSFASQLAQHADDSLHHMDGGQHHALQEQASAAAQHATQSLAILAQTGIRTLQIVVYTGFLQVPTAVLGSTCWASPAQGRAPPLLV
jgi:hypothetical protein